MTGRRAAKAHHRGDSVNALLLGSDRDTDYYEKKYVFDPRTIEENHAHGASMLMHSILTPHLATRHQPCRAVDSQDGEVQVNENTQERTVECRSTSGSNGIAARSCC